jgi:Zn-finger nucleic acid-binding protein
MKNDVLNLGHICDRCGSKLTWMDRFTKKKKCKTCRDVIVKFGEFSKIRETTTHVNHIETPHDYREYRSNGEVLNNIDWSQLTGSAHAVTMSYNNIKSYH